MKPYIFFFLIILFTTLPAQSSKTFPNLSGEYLGQKPPGIVPELFAPGIVCTGFNERDVTISPDGKEIYFGLLTGRHITIMATKLVNGIWTEPEAAQFAKEDNYFFLEPCLSPDGNKISYLSTRPPKGKEPKPRWTYQNIWTSVRNPDGSWDEPYMDTMINRGNAQYYPSFTKDGTIYFTANDLQTKKPVLYRAEMKDGLYLLPERLPAVINRDGTSIYNAFISPDESFLIACIDGIENEINPGFANYYIFFRDENDNWSGPVSFGPEINMKGSTAMSASVSPDGKYLFFAAQKISKANEELFKQKTIGKMIQLVNSPQNGNYDIYWFDAKVIDLLKAKTR
ncbi:MAG: hypothetical protein AB1521_00490 [Bacteroidota bacterium]